MENLWDNQVVGLMSKYQVFIVFKCAVNGNLTSVMAPTYCQGRYDIDSWHNGSWKNMNKTHSCWKRLFRAMKFKIRWTNRSIWLRLQKHHANLSKKQCVMWNFERMLHFCLTVQWLIHCIAVCLHEHIGKDGELDFFLGKSDCKLSRYVSEHQ